jgi:hypothetical protein
MSLKIFIYKLERASSRERNPNKFLLLFAKILKSIHKGDVREKPERMKRRKMFKNKSTGEEVGGNCNSNGSG